jgi:HPt (histidine-containing phosphotransfer) domain-containing protein
MASRAGRKAETEAVADPLVFDRVHLARYTMDSVDLEREIIQLFLAQLPETLAMIGAAVEAAEWKLATHSLKGSAAAVGAHRINQLAEALEQFGARATPERDALLRDLGHAVNEFRNLVARIYS